MRKLMIAIIAVVLIILTICSLVAASVYYGWSATAAPGSLEIKHTLPSPPFTVANPITLSATVTGDISTVELSYWTAQQPSGCEALSAQAAVTVLMAPSAPGSKLYTYTLPAREVTGACLSYYFTATDKPGMSTRTDNYYLSIGDFAWHSPSTELTVTRCVTQSVHITLDSINSFNTPVSVAATSPLPVGVQFAQATAQVTPTGDVSIAVTASKEAQIGEHQIDITATYSPAGFPDVQVTRSTTLTLNVVDFWISVSPSSLTVRRGNTAHYTLILKVPDGFITPDGFKFNVYGLPAGTLAKFNYAGYTIDCNKTSTLTYTLDIPTTSGFRSGTYDLSVVVSAVPTINCANTCEIIHAVNNVVLQIHVIDC